MGREIVRNVKCETCGQPATEVVQSFFCGNTSSVRGWCKEHSLTFTQRTEFFEKEKRRAKRKRKNRAGVGDAGRAGVDSAGPGVVGD